MTRKLRKQKKNIPTTIIFYLSIKKDSIKYETNREKKKGANKYQFEDRVSEKYLSRILNQQVLEIRRQKNDHEEYWNRFENLDQKTKVGTLHHASVEEYFWTYSGKFQAFLHDTTMHHQHGFEVVKKNNRGRC